MVVDPESTPFEPVSTFRQQESLKSFQKSIPKPRDRLFMLQALQIVDQDLIDIDQQLVNVDQQSVDIDQQL